MPEPAPPQQSGRAKPRRGRPDLLVVGSGADERSLSSLSADFTHRLDLSGPAELDGSRFWERFAESVDGDLRRLLPHLSMIDHAARYGFAGGDETQQSYQALSLFLTTARGDSPNSGALHGFNANAQSGASFDLLGISIPFGPVNSLLRWIAYGGRRALLERSMSGASRLHIVKARELAQKIAQFGPDEQDHPGLLSRRDDLAAIYANAFLLDVLASGLEIVVVGAEGDLAAQFAQQLRDLGRHTTNGRFEEYRHEREGNGNVPASSGGKLTALLHNEAKYEQWQYYSADRTAGAKRGSTFDKGGRRKALKAVAIVGVVAVVLAVAFVVFRPFGWGCGDSVFGPTGFPRTCQPISDGTNCTEERLELACKVLREQNADAEEVEHFTVVLALPLTFKGSDPNQLSDMVDQIQGAIAAQAIVNDGQNHKMRLLLADLGSGNEGWEEAADAIVDRRDQDGIIAVAGGGSSFRTTERFVERIAEAGLVFMGATMTGDSMLPRVNDPDRTTFRVSPTNTQEAAAIVDFIAGRTDPCEAVIIRDDDKDYDYAATLYQGFTTALTEHGCAELPRPYNYDGSDKAGINASSFNGIVEELCQEITGDRYVFFAGLGKGALPSLIRSLQSRGNVAGCDEHRLTIVSGDDASTTPSSTSYSYFRDSAGVDLYVMGLSHPEQWAEAGPGDEDSRLAMAHAVEDLAETFGMTALDLGDGQALMSFEAVRVVGAAAQQEGFEVASDDLAEILRDYAAPGVTGTLTFGPDGNPVDKTMVVLRATGDEADPVEVVELVNAS